MPKTATAALVAGLAFLLTGCGDPAVSVRPLYTAGEKPAAEPRLEGQWISDDQDAPQRWNVTAEPDGCYRAQVQKASADKDKEDQSETYSACLVRLQDKLFFDSELLVKNFGARGISVNDLGSGVIRTHIVGRLWVDSGLLRIVRLNSKWVQENTPEEFREMRNRSAVITGSTEKLRQVITEHADDATTWTAATYLCHPAIDCQMRVTEDKLARAPDDADVLQGTAAFYITRGDTGKAVKLTRHAAEIKPAEASAHGYLALALGYQRDFEGARRELAAAQKLHSETQPLYQFYTGLSYFLEGKYQEASRELAMFRAGQKEQAVGAILFSYFAALRAGRPREGKAFLARETERFTGSGEDQLLLLQAADRVTDPTWSNMGKDAKSDIVLLYAENCLAQGDGKAARVAFEHILSKPGEDLINALVARIELERLEQSAKLKAER